MIFEGYRVLEAIEWTERTGASTYVPLKQIATLALGGDADLAATILAELDRRGLVRSDSAGWRNGWLTPKGRLALAESPAL